MITLQPRWLVSFGLLVMGCVAPPGCGMFEKDADPPNAAESDTAVAEGDGAASGDDDSDAEADRLAEEAREYAGRIADAGGQGAGPRANALDIMPGELTPSDRGPRSTGNDADDTPDATAAPSGEPDQSGGGAAEVVVEPDAAAPPRPLSREQLLSRLRDTLTRGGGNDLRRWLQRASLASLDPERAITAEQLQHLPAAERDVVLDYQRLARRIAALPTGDADQQRAELENAVHKLHQTVAGQRPFEIAALELCRKVNGFGVYDPFERTTFLVGRKHPVIVYAELANFHTESEGDEHVARLTQELILYNESDGLPVWRQQPEQIVDRSRNRRRDFFVVQLIHLSERLSVGKYHLKVRITDRIAQEVDEQSLPITIVADPELVRQP